MNSVGNANQSEHGKSVKPHKEASFSSTEVINNPDVQYKRPNIRPNAFSS